MALSPAESIPSLGEVSTETENDDGVARKLFQTPELKQTKEWEAMITDIASPFKPSGPELPVSCVGDNTDGTTIDVVLDPQKQTYTEAVAELATANHTSGSIANASIGAIDVPKDDKKPTSSLQSTSVKQLVGIFSMFGEVGLCKPTSQWSQALSQEKIDLERFENDEPVPHDTCSPQDSASSFYSFPSDKEDTFYDPEERRKQKVEALERECNALQGIVCADAVNTIKLKHEVNTLKESNGQHISEIQLLSSTLKSTVQTIESLDREKEEHEDRDVARLETIKVLKDEIDRLTQARENKDNICSPYEIAQMQLERELFAEQILRDEHALKEACATLKKQDTIILQMKQRLEVLRARLVAMEALGGHKLDDLEKEKHLMKLKYEESLQAKNQEINEMKEMLEDAQESEEKGEDEALNGSLRTEIHLAETEQDLERVLQLLKEQEEHVWYLEKRIVRLTPPDENGQSNQENTLKKPPSGAACPILCGNE